MKTRHAKESGAVAVEFALMLPMLLLLVFGAIDVGRAYRLQTRLANAAREGAVFAQYYPSQVDASTAACADPNNLKFVLRHEERLPTTFSFSVSMVGAGGLTLPVPLPVLGCNLIPVLPDSRLLVKASADFRVLTPILSAIVGNAITLRGSSEVVVQG